MEFIWSPECNESFKLLKRKLAKAPILRFPDWTKKFHVHVDASNVAINTVLAQPSNEMVDHPNAYASRKLNKAKGNYSTIKREGLGMSCINLGIIYGLSPSYLTQSIKP